jgi:hypothetical protein
VLGLGVARPDLGVGIIALQRTKVRSLAALLALPTRGNRHLGNRRQETKVANHPERGRTKNPTAGWEAVQIGNTLYLAMLTRTRSRSG